jgi:hypothetical protein
MVGRLREPADGSALSRARPRQQLVVIEANVSTQPDVWDAVGSRFGQDPRVRDVQQHAGFLGVE